MILFKKRKDGGKESTVIGYWLIEIKPLFSIVLLKFDGPSRRAFHTHAFNCINWLISGKLIETFLPQARVQTYKASFRPFIVRREDFHRVDSIGVSWVLSIRGPWKNTWKEFISGTYRTLTHGRRIIND